eukprot:911528-Prymnesium_polylepis.1
MRGAEQYVEGGIAAQYVEGGIEDWRASLCQIGQTRQTLARRARCPDVQTLSDAARRPRCPYHVRTTSRH